MKITLAQLNPTVGDIEGNLAQIKKTISKFGEVSDLIVFPELFITGYPPRDLLEKSAFIEKAQRAVQKVAEVSSNHLKTGIILGAPTPTGKKTGKGLNNSALLIHRGRILFTQHKSLLPTYDVFDEARYFDPASAVRVIRFEGSVLGISICEDAWNEPQLWPQGKMYPVDPIKELAKKGASIFINISASPFCVGKEELRYHIFKNHARKHGCPLVYVNQVGGNDDLIFDGRSLCLDRKGNPIHFFPPFKGRVKTIDMEIEGNPGLFVPEDKIEAVYRAIILGIRDYMRKCGFSKAVIGLSGGIDSSVTCCLAKEAIGPENVLGISMPSLFSLKESLEYAKKLTENLGVELEVVPITSIYHSYLRSLGKLLGSGKDIDIALENIQARIRGNILMAYSNKYGCLVLSTGNKSELAMGYCTLYGDMTGGLAVISDVPKTMVYELARFVNRESEVIPTAILERKPTAELKPGQLDQDTLPPYEVLDRILYYYIEEGCSSKELLGLNFKPEMVERVIRRVDKNEYKRRQAAPGLKVTSKAFGIGRRMPIAANYGK
jgi:NAD+ synthase (glutamine-hydrolysing)